MDPMQPIFPPALKPGDTIALVAPAGVLKRRRIERAIERIELAGFRIKTYGDIYRARGYLAGDDATRASELMAAFTDPTVQAVFPARGGYGITRLLDRLDYDVIGEQPKIVTGFSDMTALHLALQRHCQWVTFHSPNPMDGLGTVDGLEGLAEHFFWRALRADRYQDDMGQSREPGYVLIDHRGSVPLEMARPGQAEGRITGGNLALVAATLGTPYEIETAGRLLFLEDIGERPYRIDRYLSQLRLAGKLREVAGIVLGYFTDCLPAEGEKSLALKEVLADYMDPLTIPVVCNFPAGHEVPNVTLPLGVLARLDADRGCLELLENPVAL
jgi:muramoyltetrapeptide carboxypeptidase